MRHRQQQQIRQRQTVERRSERSSDTGRNRRQTRELPENVDQANYRTENAHSWRETPRDFEHLAAASLCRSQSLVFYFQGTTAMRARLRVHSEQQCFLKEAMADLIDGAVRSRACRSS
jgi:hypothetical protein